MGIQGKVELNGLYLRAIDDSDTFVFPLISVVVNLEVLPKPRIVPIIRHSQVGKQNCPALFP